jgi:hypothetical protein
MVNQISFRMTLVKHLIYNKICTVVCTQGLLSMHICLWYDKMFAVSVLTAGCALLLATTHILLYCSN